MYELKRIDTTTSVLAPICQPEDSESPVQHIFPSNNTSQQTAAEKIQCGIKGLLKLLSKFGQFLWKRLTSHLGLFIILTLYTFIGGAVMLGIEGYFSGLRKQEPKCKAAEKYHDFQEYFVNRTMGKSWNNSEVDDKVLYSFLLEYEREKREHEECIRECPDYWDWLLFCLTVYTTIGK